MNYAYEKVRDHILGIIKKSPPGSRLPTERELCETMNLSRVTVRKALAILAGNGLIVRKKSKGSFIREQNLKSKQLHVAILIPDDRQDSSAFNGEILTGCLSRAMANGTLLHIFPFNPGPIIHQMISDCGADAVLIIAPNKEQMSVLDDFLEYDRPVVVVNREIHNQRINFVSTDHARGAEEATRYFIEKGHQRIAFVGCDRNISYIRDRHEGYLAAFAKAGVIADPKLTFPMEIDLQPVRQGLATAAFSKFMMKNQPTALLASGAGVLHFIVTPVVRSLEKLPEMATFDELWNSNPFKAVIHEIIQVPRAEIGHLALWHLERLTRLETKQVRILLAPVMRIKNHTSPGNQSLSSEDKAF